MSCKAPEFLTLLGEGNVEIRISARAAEYSTLLKDLMEDLSYKDLQDPVPLQQFQPEIIKLVVDWCEHHVKPLGPWQTLEGPWPRPKPHPVPRWDAEYLRYDFEDRFTLLNLAKLADFLDVEPLLDYIARVIANNLVGKSAADMRAYFGLKPDLILEDEAEIRRQTDWARDGEQSKEDEEGEYEQYEDEQADDEQSEFSHSERNISDYEEEDSA
ncbi:hypothetical protein GGR52DRAFT_569809 [Hypoxylon sp. FL1284]|nr:hypothetical protein GGR52DRAFT_569809 [Hypoxylon sp. FL1284]